MRMKEKAVGLTIILLAAGDSRRFHGNKMLADIDGEAMFLRMVKNIQGITADKKVVVTQYREIIDYLCNSLRDPFIHTVKNDHSEKGISYSIQLGLEYCNDTTNSTNAYLFAVCDQPWLTQKSIEKLIKAYALSEKKIACLSYQGKLGNPVIFDEYYLKELLALEGDSGGKSIVNRHKDDVEIIEVDDEKELMDVDTRQDYDILK